MEEADRDPGDERHMKQQTRWIWRHQTKRGTGIWVGWVYNRRPRPGDTADAEDDVVRVVIRSASTPVIEMSMQPWEAVSLIAGLAKTLAVAQANGLCEHKPKKI